MKIAISNIEDININKLKNKFPIKVSFIRYDNEDFSDGIIIKNGSKLYLLSNDEQHDGAYPISIKNDKFLYGWVAEDGIGDPELNEELALRYFFNEFEDLTLYVQKNNITKIEII